MEKNRFTICANNYIDCLRQEGRYSTAHVYKHAIRSFSQFCGTQSITFSKINRETLKRYSNYLMASRLKPNTISTYMRMLRSIYNRGVDMHQAPYVHGLFRDVFTGVDTRQKKAIPIGELHMLLNKDPQSEKLRRPQGHLLPPNVPHLPCLISSAFTSDGGGAGSAAARRPQHPSG